MKPLYGALGALALAASAGLAAASPPPAPMAAPVATPAANPSDTASPEAIVQATYATISGSAGQKRDWDRLRSLMLPDGRFVATHVMPDGAVRTRLVSTQQYVDGASKFFDKEGFFEHGVIQRIDRLPHVATVISPYVSRHASGEKPFARGVNQFQLVNDGKRWWIVDIIWEDESPSNPLPADAAALLAGER